MAVRAGGADSVQAESLLFVGTQILGWSLACADERETIMRAGGAIASGSHRGVGRRRAEMSNGLLDLF